MNNLPAKSNFIDLGMLCCISSSSTQYSPQVYMGELNDKDALAVYYSQITLVEYTLIPRPAHKYVAIGEVMLDLSRYGTMTKNFNIDIFKESLKWYTPFEYVNCIRDALNIAMMDGYRETKLVKNGVYDWSNVQKFVADMIDLWDRKFPNKTIQYMMAGRSSMKNDVDLRLVSPMTVMEHSKSIVAGLPQRSPRRMFVSELYYSDVVQTNITMNMLRYTFIRGLPSITPLFEHNKNYNVITAFVEQFDNEQLTRKATTQYVQSTAEKENQMQKPTFYVSKSNLFAGKQQYVATGQNGMIILRSQYGVLSEHHPANVKIVKDWVFSAKADPKSGLYYFCGPKDCVKVGDMLLHKGGIIFTVEDVGVNSIGKVPHPSMTEFDGSILVTMPIEKL